MNKYHKPKVSVVMPAYNEQDNIEWFSKEIASQLKKAGVDYEIYYVDDGSSDNTAKIVTDLAKNDAHIKLIRLARNFGKEAATSAGLHYATGDAVIVLDADGQHPADLIPRFIEEWKGGAQQVIGIRTSNEKAGFVKTVGSKVFYMLSNALGAHVRRNATDFRLLDREVVDTFKDYTERKRMTRALLDWSGYETIFIDFEAKPRLHGVAAYSVRSLIRLALNGYISSTLKPLYIISLFGAVITVLSLFAAAFIIIEQVLLNDPLGLGITGTAVIGIFVMFLVGILMIAQGIAAIYIANIHLEVQNRPLYIVNRARSIISKDNRNE